MCPPIESCALLALLEASGQSSITLPGFQKGSEYRVGEHTFTANRQTDFTISQSASTGNALVSFVGELEVHNVFGPVDAKVTAGAVDIGTGAFEAHGHADIPLGQLLMPLRVKGNAREGRATGACVLICVPLPPSEDEATSESETQP